MENTSKQVYIINLSNAIVMVQSNNEKKDTIVTLQPYQCSLTTFDLGYLQKEAFVMGLYANGLITFSETPKKVIPNKSNKDCGQKYKIGQHVFIVGEHNLTGVVDEYFPTKINSKGTAGVYSVKLDKTGGCPQFGEYELSLTPFNDRQTEDDIQGTVPENPQLNAQKGLGLVNPSRIVSSENVMGMGQNAESTLNNLDNIAKNIQQAQSQTQIRTSNVQQYQEQQNQSTFIDDSGAFGVEKVMTTPKNLKNVVLEDVEVETPKVVTASVESVAVSKEAKATPAKATTKEDKLKAMYDKLSKEDKEFFEEFKKLDYRGKKLAINELEDETKLEIIAMFATDETSRKGAAAKLSALEK